MRNQARQIVHDHPVGCGRNGGTVPRRSKGPHLWLRSAQYGRDGKLTHVAAWLILDGTIQRGTGLGIGATDREKDLALKAYLTEKHTATVTTVTLDPAFILIDDVLALYARKIVPKHARPAETAARIGELRKFFGGKRLSFVTGDTCEQYAARRSTPGAARRELEDLRAAVNYHRKRGLHDRLVSVTLPEKAEGRSRWLTRDEAARLVWAAWRFKDSNPFQRRSRRHVARFMVVARYMGSRAAVICGASIEEKRPDGQPWVDLVNGVFYGRPEGQRVTKKRRQTVQVPGPLMAHLRRWRRSGQRYAVEWRGKPVTRVSKGHAAAVSDAGLGVDVTPHTWRHTVATWLMQAGGDPWKIAGFLRMSYETLMRVYGHHHPKDSAEVHAAMRAHRQRIVNDTSERKGISAKGSAPERAAKPVSST